MIHMMGISFKLVRIMYNNTYSEGNCELENNVEHYTQNEFEMVTEHRIDKSITFYRCLSCCHEFI